jgi:hypothetical protein
MGTEIINTRENFIKTKSTYLLLMHQDAQCKFAFHLIGIRNPLTHRFFCDPLFTCMKLNANSLPWILRISVYSMNDSSKYGLVDLLMDLGPSVGVHGCVYYPNPDSTIGALR